MPQRFEHHARTVTLLTFLSRITGLARDAALARIFGVTALMDAFWLAFLVPNLFRRLFGEGALSAAFLPAYSRLQRDDPHAARQLATLTIALMLMALGGLTLLGEVALLAISLAAPASESGEGLGSGMLAVRLMMIMLPYMPLVCVVAVLGAMLQVHGRFGPTAAAPIVLNLFIVIAAVGFAWPRGGGAAGDGGGAAARAGEIAHIAAVAGAVLLAGAVQVAWSLIALRRAGERWLPLRSAMSGGGEHMRSVLHQAWPMFLGLGVLQLNTFLDGLIASYPSTFGSTILGREFPLDSGALTALNNAQRLYEFPLGVFGIAIATAIFPALARVAKENHHGEHGEHGEKRLAASDDHLPDRRAHGGESAEFADILRRGLRLVVYIGLPASAGLMLVREPLTAAVLQGGDFSSNDTRRVAFVLLGYAPAIWAYSMTHVLTRAFYARGDSRTPVKVAVMMVALNLALNLTLIWTPLKEAGLAWSTAICAVVQVLWLLRLTYRHAAHIVDRSVLMSWLRSAIVTAAMAAMVWAIATLILPPHELTWRWSLLQLALLVPAGAASVAIASALLRMPEMSWALGRGGERA